MIRYAKIEHILKIAKKNSSLSFSSDIRQDINVGIKKRKIELILQLN